jgi:hypothetical protein
MVNAHGPQANHSVRDPAILEDWFFQQLDVPFEQAVSMAGNSTNLPTEQLLRLGRLKDRVRLMKCIKPQEVFRRLDELNVWYTLLDTSPG